MLGVIWLSSYISAYFNNDYQNITVSVANTFLQKWNVSGTAGVQQDDLNGAKMSNMKRIAASLALSYTASERLQADVSYNNFQSYTHIKPQFETINQLTPYDNLDTLNYTQLAQQANMNINYQLSNGKQQRQSLHANLSYQDATDKQGPSATSTGGMKFYNANAGYNLSLVPTNTSLTAAFNVSYITAPDNHSLTWGPTVAITRPFFNKQFKTRLSASYNSSATNSHTQITLVNLRAGGSYTYKQKHNISINAVSLFRTNKVMSSSYPPHFRELTTTLAYSYSF